jgi:HK97 gp10 family phage protein
VSRPRLSLTGNKALEKQLKTLGERVAKKHLRRAATAAVAPMRKAVKSKVPVDTGALKRSIASKVTQRGLYVNGMVGSDVAQQDESGEPAARHLHLTEFGFQHANGSTVAGSAPLRAGHAASVGQAQATYEAKLKDGIEKEAMKGGR